MITLGAGVFAGTAAMVFFLQDTGTSRLGFFMGTYIPGVAIPIAVLWILPCLRIHGEKRQFYFDWPTRFTAIVVCALSILTLSVVTTLGMRNCLPGQPAIGPRPLAFDDAYSPAKDNGDQEIIASIEFGTRLYPEGLPKSLIVAFSLRQPLSSRWEIREARLLETLPSGQETLVLGRGAGEGIGPDFLPFSFDKVKPNTAYRMAVELRALEPLEASELESDIESIKDGKGIKALDRSTL